MRPGIIRFFKNGLSNALSAVSAAALAIVVPYFFVRSLSFADFSLWVLVLQVGSYVNYLNFGVQVAIGRYVAYALGRHDQIGAEKILGAGLQMLSVLGAIGLFVIVVLALSFSFFFKGVSPSMWGTARESLLWIGSALAFALPFSAFAGVFIGMQRNEIPALVSVFGKIILAMGLVWVARATRALVPVSQIYFVGLMASYILQLALFFVVCRRWRLRVFEKLAATRMELVNYCISLGAWSLSMFLINGVDTTIVGIFSFSSVAAYGIALSGTNSIVMAFSAMATPLIQTFTHRHVKKDLTGILSLLDASAYMAAVFLIVMGAWLIAASQAVFPVWVGHRIADNSIPIFIVLVLAQIIRLSSAPYAYYLIATGQQSYAMVSPFAEGFANLAASIAGVMMFGAIGVAFGTVIGAIVGILGHYLYSMPRTMPSDFSRLRFFRKTALKPLIWSFPTILASLLGYFLRIPPWWLAALMILTTLPVAYRGWHDAINFGLIPSPDLPRPKA